MKKYIIPFLFLIMTFVMLPKQAYYQRGDINVKIELTNPSSAYIYLGETRETSLKNYIYYFSGEGLNQNIKNSAIHKAIVHIYSGEAYIKSIKLNNKKLEIQDNLKVYEFNWKKLYKFYKFSSLNLFLYLALCSSLIYCFFKKGVEISKDNFIGFLFGSYILSIAINQGYSNKILGLLLSLAFLKIIFYFKNLHLGKIEIGLLVLLLLSFLSEKYSYGNYEQMYQSFQNTFLLILSLKIFKLDLKNKENIKKYFKYSGILLMGVNFIAPIPLGGIYIFTFGVFSIFLLLNSFRELLKYKNLDKVEIMLSIFQMFLGIYGLIYSERRTMALVLLVYIAYLLTLYLIRNNKKGLEVLVLICFVLVVGFKLIDSKNENKFTSRVKSIFTIKANESNYQRVLMWRKGSYIFLENPILGIGVDSFYEESIKEKYNDIKHKDEKFINIFNHVHNEYIHQLISRGIFGAIIFFSLWIYILKHIKKSEDKEFDTMLLILYGVYGIFDSYSIRIDSIFLYIFIGLTFGNTLIGNKNENKVLQKLGYLSTVTIFLISLYFNKRFRYYFLISLVLYSIYYFYKKRKRVKL